MHIAMDILEEPPVFDQSGGKMMNLELNKNLINLWNDEIEVSLVPCLLLNVHRVC